MKRSLKDIYILKGENCGKLLYLLQFKVLIGHVSPVFLNDLSHKFFPGFPPNFVEGKHKKNLWKALKNKET